MKFSYTPKFNFTLLKLMKEEGNTHHIALFWALHTNIQTPNCGNKIKNMKIPIVVTSTFKSKIIMEIRQDHGYIYL